MQKAYIVYGPDPSGDNPWVNQPYEYYDNHKSAEKHASTIKGGYVRIVNLLGSSSKEQIIDDMDDLVGNKIAATLLDIMTLKEEPNNPEVVTRMERVLKTFMSEYNKIRCK